MCDHCDGLIPMEHICDDAGEPLWQSGLAHDINAFNNEVLASDESSHSIMLSSTNGDGTEENPKDYIYIYLYIYKQIANAPKIEPTEQTWLPGS